MKIVCTNSVPTAGSGFFVHAEYLATAPAAWQRLDLRPTIREHEDRWLDQIQSWHGEVNRCALGVTSWWWLTATSRLITWLPPVFDHLIIALAIIEVCRAREIDTIHLVQLPAGVLAFLRELKPGVAIDDQSAATPATSPSASPGTSASAGPSRFAKIVTQLSNVVTRRRPELPDPICDLLICSLVLNTQVLREVGDHFFGRAFDPASSATNESPLKVIWLYPLGIKDVNKRAEIMRIPAPQGRQVLIPDDFLTAGDLLRTALAVAGLLASIGRIERALPTLTIDGMQSRLMGRVFLRRLLREQLPYNEIKFYYALRRVLSVVKPKGLLYPYEEKGLERGLLRACEETRPEMKTIGFAHAVAHNGHRYFQTGLHGDVTPIGPDYLLSTGPGASSWLVRRAGKDPSRLRVFGSPRFREPLPLPAGLGEAGHTLKVLFIVSAHYEIGRLAEFVEKVPHLLDGCHLKARLYPFERLAEQMHGVERLRSVGALVDVDSAPLIGQLEWADVVLFCSTSAGIEAMLAGRYTAYVDLNEVFTLDVLQDKGDLSAVGRCQSADEISNTLERVRQMNSEQYAVAVQRQIEFARTIYAKPDLKRLNEILSSGRK